MFSEKGTINNNKNSETNYCIIVKWLQYESGRKINVFNNVFDFVFKLAITTLFCSTQYVLTFVQFWGQLPLFAIFMIFPTTIYKNETNDLWDQISALLQPWCDYLYLCDYLYYKITFNLIEIFIKGGRKIEVEFLNKNDI